MPNYCKNKLEITGPAEDLARLREAAVGQGDNVFSLQSLFPCPEPLMNVPSGPDMGYRVKYTDEWGSQIFGDYFSGNYETREEAYAALEERSPILTEHTETYKANFDRYGFLDWYEWKCHHWGVKWDPPVGPKDVMIDVPDTWVLKFESAWCPPTKALDKIAADYPALDFVLSYWEDGGWFAGDMVWRHGMRGHETKGDLDKIRPDVAERLRREKEEDED